jgi:PiT family inorganic phosphate transporter
MPEFALGYLIIIVIFAVGFGLVNGFNDAANAIAAAIGTRSLYTRNAVAILPVPSPVWRWRAPSAKEF